MCADSRFIAGVKVYSNYIHPAHSLICCVAAIASQVIWADMPTPNRTLLGALVLLIGTAIYCLIPNSASAEHDTVQPQPLVLYGTSWCGYCKRARFYLRENNIAYADLDIERNPAAERAYNRLGVSGVPVFVQGDRKLRGFSIASFEAFYQPQNAIDQSDR